MNEQVDLIKKNARIVIDQLRQLSDMDFGMNRESVVWVEGFIERQRARPDFDSAFADKLTQTLGSFLGECIIANGGGAWLWSDDHQSWSIVFSNNSQAFPFVKVGKMFADGLEGGESIVSFYDIAVAYLSKSKLNNYQF
jgi:hypothetical protein